jgi:hypothetical protein
VLSGQALASALPAPLLAERFGAALEPAGQAGALVWGLPGDSLSAGRRLLLVGEGGAGNQVAPEVLAPLGGHPVFAWAEEQPQLCAALRAPERDAWLFAFGLEAVNGDPDWASSREDLFAALFDPGTAVPAAPRPQRLDPVLSAWPNPFNPELRLRLEGLGPATVEIHDLLGRPLARWEEVAPGATLIWRPGRAASGLYLLQARDRSGRVVRGKALLVR